MINTTGSGRNRTAPRWFALAIALAIGITGIAIGQEESGQPQAPQRGDQPGAAQQQQPQQDPAAQAQQQPGAQGQAEVTIGRFLPQRVFAEAGYQQQLEQRIRQARPRQGQGGQQQAVQEIRAAQQEVFERFRADLEEVAPQVAQGQELDAIVQGEVAFSRDTVAVADVTDEMIRALQAQRGEESETQQRQPQQPLPQQRQQQQRPQPQQQDRQPQQQPEGR